MVANCHVENRYLKNIYLLRISAELVQLCIIARLSLSAIKCTVIDNKTAYINDKTAVYLLC